MLDNYNRGRGRVRVFWAHWDVREALATSDRVTKRDTRGNVMGVPLLQINSSEPRPVPQLSFSPMIIIIVQSEGTREREGPGLESKRPSGGTRRKESQQE